MPTFRGVDFQLTGPVSPVPLADVRAAEEILGCSFPSSFRDFILEFGAGEFLGFSLRTHPPFCITHNAAADRERFQQYWFWDQSPEVWSQQQACESFMCFDGDGDDVRFHPSDPETMYLLPYGDEHIYRAFSFAELVSCFARVALYDLASRPLVFEPWHPSKA